MTSSDTAVFEECPTSVVSDALDEFGIDGVLTGLRPANPGHVAVGRARPVRFEPVSGGERTNFPFAMLEAFAPDAVFVLAGVSPELSHWGGLASRLAANAGMAGVVVDGGYRDAPEIRAGSFPVFGRARTPKTGQRRLRIASVGEPVDVDGVTVAAEDVVVADATGVVVVPGDRAGAIAAAAREILESERELEEEVADGADVAALKADHEGF